MTKHRNRVTIFAAASLISIGAMLSPLSAHAQSSEGLESQLCTSNPHAFITSLIDSKAIQQQPSRVEPDSINVFRPTHGTHLRAFDFPVYIVIGYEPDSPLFHAGKGKATENKLYGVVVSAPVDTVRRHVHETGSTATVEQAVPMLLTAIICTGTTHHSDHPPHDASHPHNVNGTNGAQTQPAHEPAAQ